MSRRSGISPANALAPPQCISLPLTVRGKRQRVAGFPIADDFHARPDGSVQDRSAHTASQPSRNDAQVVVPVALLEQPPQAGGVENTHVPAPIAGEPQAVVVGRNGPQIGHSMGRAADEHVGALVEHKGNIGYRGVINESARTARWPGLTMANSIWRLKAQQRSSSVQG